MKKLLIISLLLIFACKNTGETKVVIVGQDGKPAKISKFTPEFNEIQMEKQKEAYKSTHGQVRMVNASPDNVDISNTSGRQSFSDNNPNVPDYLFDDRVVNYAKVDNQDNLIVNKQTSGKLKTNAITEVNIDNTEVSERSSVKYVLNSNTNPVIETKKAGDRAKKTTTVAASGTGTTAAVVKTTTVAKSTSAKANDKVSDKPEPGKSFYIQLGIFVEKTNADDAYKRYSKIDKCVIKDHVSKGKKAYKVQMGPYSDRKTAETFLDKVISSGHYDTYITQE